jgi:SAM-dependent methyltransferase
MVDQVAPSNIDPEQLRQQLREKYTDVALAPENRSQFHSGRALALMLGYDAADIDELPPANVDSFVGSGNPFSMGRLRPGERVADIGCGAGFDTFQAARQVGPAGHVIAVDMTPAMCEKTKAGAAALGLEHVDVRHGYMEELPIDDESVDVVISNGVINLSPDKVGTLREVYRVLRPGGRFQIGDIIVHKEVSLDAKDDIDLWSG